MCLWWYIHCSIVRAACLILLAGVVQITDNKRTRAAKTDVKNGLTEPLKSTGKWSYKDALNQICCMQYVIWCMSHRSQCNGLLCSLKCDKPETKGRRNRKNYYREPEESVEAKFNTSWTWKAQQTTCSLLCNDVGMLSTNPAAWLLTVLALIQILSTFLSINWCSV